MKELFNFQWDYRTAFNICKMPFIICLRVPFVLILMFFVWIADNADIISDYLPGWDSGKYQRKNTYKVIKPIE